MSIPNSDNSITLAHIHGIWAVVAAVLGALVGAWVGSSWQERMAQQVYSDNNALQNKILELTQEKENIKNDFNNIYKELSDKKIEYDNLKNRYEIIAHRYNEIQKNNKQTVNVSTPKEVEIVPSIPAPHMLHDDRKQLPLMQVAAPYVFHYGEAYTNGKTFTMSGNKYTDGFILRGGHVYKGFALINLQRKFSSLVFYAGHVDGTDMYNKGTNLTIYVDGKIIKEVYIPEDRIAQKITVPLNYANELKIQAIGGGGEYGIANAVLKD